MAGIKIPNLPAIVTPALTDVFPIDQSGTTYKESITQLGTLLVPIGGGTMTGNLILNTSSPTTGLQAASKAYVDTVAQGLTVIGACLVGTTGALTVTYANGTAGVGATLTNAGAQAALTIDSVALSVNDRVLVKDQASSFQNGIYTVTNIGSGATNWIMTRATDYDTPAQIQPGDFVIVNLGTVNTQTSWLQTATVTAVGTDAILFSQFTSNPATFLKVANNLSDVASQITAFDNIMPNITVTGSSVALAANSKYTMNRATLITAVLPTTIAVGQEIVIVGLGAGGWILTQNANQIIHIGSAVSTTGATGSVASGNRYDCIHLSCIVANLEFTMRSGVSQDFAIV